MTNEIQWTLDKLQFEIQTTNDTKNVLVKYDKVLMAIQKLAINNLTDQKMNNIGIEEAMIQCLGLITDLQNVLNAKQMAECNSNHQQISIDSITRLMLKDILTLDDLSIMALLLKGLWFDLQIKSCDDVGLTSVTTLLTHMSKRLKNLQTK